MKIGAYSMNLNSYNILSMERQMTSLPATKITIIMIKIIMKKKVVFLATCGQN